MTANTQDLNNILNQFIKDHPDALITEAPVNSKSKTKEDNTPVTYDDLSAKQRNLLMLGHYRDKDLRKKVWESWAAFRLTVAEVQQELQNKVVTGQSKDVLAMLGVLRRR